MKAPPETIAPMEALLVAEIPRGDQWQYEPKWDGFRCIAVRKGDRITLQSKAGKPLDRYFPELVEALRTLAAPRFMLDGEIVVPMEHGLDFDQLLQRIHPAASRVRKLAAEHPAHFMVFDLLADENGNSLLTIPLAQRRARLETWAHKYFSKLPLVRLSPATARVNEAEGWLDVPGSFVDGVIAKRLDLPYAAGKRTAMQKYKRIRTADCVVGGFRYLTKTTEVGSLLLGLYEGELLHHVGFASGIKAGDRKALTKKLRPLIGGPGFTGRAPGGPSRWSTERSADWQPLKPELVVEVSFDHVTGERFRHGTNILRWRPDKSPAQCIMEQIQPPKTTYPRDFSTLMQTIMGRPK